MKATINSFVKGSVSVVITDVHKAGTLCVVKKSGDNGYLVISGTINIQGSISMPLPWSIEDVVKNELKLLYKSDNYQEVVDFDLSGLLSTIQLLQADFSKEMPGSISKIAACTICYNEDFIISKWAEYYGRIFGYENLFIIDDGSDTPVSEVLAGLPVNITRIPRTTFDSWRLVRTLGIMQRLLLETYDLVITSDSDEFITCSSEDGEDDLNSYLQSKKPEDMVNVAPVGFDLIHNRLQEADLDSSRPILEQRNYVRRSKGFDKPVMSTVPTSFLPGLHNSYFPKRVDTNLTLLHVRAFDFKFALSKLERYSKTTWSPHDLKSGLAYHQRAKAEELDFNFAGIDKQIADCDKGKKMMDLGELEAGVLAETIRRRIAI